MSSKRPEERPLERMARAIVAHHLDTLVQRSDDGTARGPDRPGSIGFGTKGWTSWQDPVTVTGWIARVLDREADVAEKLQRHG